MTGKSKLDASGFHSSVEVKAHDQTSICPKNEFLSL